MDDQPDLFASLAARDAALASVSEHTQEWQDEAMAALRRLPVGFAGTGEEIGWAMGVGSPPDPHAWGAFVNSARRAGLICRTGAWRPMQVVSSHARLTPVWRRV